MTLEQFFDVVLALVVLAVGALSKILWGHSKEITRLDAQMMPEKSIRDIMERETDRLHEDQKEFRDEVREDMKLLFDKIDGLRKDIAKSRADD